MTTKRKIKEPPPCLQADQHGDTDAPSGYLARFEWAEEMSRTHEQRQCPGCGLYKIWMPRDGAPPMINPEDYEPDADDIDAMTPRRVGGAVRPRSRRRPGAHQVADGVRPGLVQPWRRHVP